MRIGIIGAGIAGLTAGKELSRAGHDVTLFEKQHGAGGRLSAVGLNRNGSSIADHGIPWFTVESPEFRGFVSELIDNEIVTTWGDNIWNYTGNKLLKNDPNTREETCFIAPGGMNKIGQHLSRWVDIRTDTKAGGVTFIGSGREKKRPWMINLTSFDTFGADAVIIALPAPQAYGILMTTQDEVNTLKITREIDEIHYDPKLTLIAGYGDAKQPEWEAIKCHDPAIRYIVNESSKRDSLTETTLVFHSTPELARDYREEKKEMFIDKMLNHFSFIYDKMGSSPAWTETSYWRFFSAGRTIDRPFMEAGEEVAPLAVVGDYFMGNSVDHAYSSGLKLAKYWIEKYKG